MYFLLDCNEHIHTFKIIIICLITTSILILVLARNTQVILWIYVHIYRHTILRAWYRPFKLHQIFYTSMSILFYDLVAEPLIASGFSTRRAMRYMSGYHIRHFKIINTMSFFFFTIRVYKYFSIHPLSEIRNLCDHN